MKKRILSMILALAMIFGMIAGTAVSVSAATTQVSVTARDLKNDASSTVYVFFLGVNGLNNQNVIIKSLMAGCDVSNYALLSTTLKSDGSFETSSAEIPAGTYKVFYTNLASERFFVSPIWEYTVQSSINQCYDTGSAKNFVNTSYDSNVYSGTGWYHIHLPATSYISNDVAHWHPCTYGSCLTKYSSSASVLLDDRTVCGNTTVGAQLKSRLGYEAHDYTDSYEQGTGENDGMHRGVCKCGAIGTWESHVYNETTHRCVCGAEEQVADYSAIEEELSNVPEDLSIYTDESVLELTSLIDSIDYNLTSSQQDDIIRLAAAIHNAISDLVLKLANYDEVDAAIAAAEEYYVNADNYINFDVVEAAINAVVRNLDITHQDEVNAMAVAIYNALELLELEDADYSEVYAAIAEAQQLSGELYTNFEILEDAIAAVVEGKKADEQGLVDEMAKAIYDAIDALIPVPEHEHTFEISEWNWISGTKISATATFKCVNCDEGDLVVPAQVTSDTDVGYITYTATVKLGETEYTTSKTDPVACEMEVKNGTIIGGLKADGDYRYNDLITVKADDPAEGKYFDGWYLDGVKVSNSQTFKFYLKSNSTIEARYADEVVEIKPQVALEFTDRVNVSGGGQQLKLIVRWELPQGYQPVEAGFVRTYEESCSKRLTLENVGGDIKKNSVAAVRNTGSYTLNVNMSAATSLKTLYYVGYLKCTNAAGEEITVYTDLAQSVREPQ